MNDTYISFGRSNFFVCIPSVDNTFGIRLGICCSHTTEEGVIVNLYCVVFFPFAEYSNLI